MTNQPTNRMQLFAALGRSGAAADVDRMMSHLHARSDFTTTKLVDYGLTLVTAPQGVARIHHYLFNGTQIQRNYAALYFKRNRDMAPLHAAVAQGMIDEIQAYLE